MSILPTDSVAGFLIGSQDQEVNATTDVITDMSNRDSIHFGSSQDININRSYVTDDAYVGDWSELSSPKLTKLKSQNGSKNGPTSDRRRNTTSNFSVHSSDKKRRLSVKQPTSSSSETPKEPLTITPWNCSDAKDKQIRKYQELRDEINKAVNSDTERKNEYSTLEILESNTAVGGAAARFRGHMSDEIVRYSEAGISGRRESISPRRENVSSPRRESIKRLSICEIGSRSDTAAIRRNSASSNSPRRISSVGRAGDSAGRSSTVYKSAASATRPSNSPKPQPLPPASSRPSVRQNTRKSVQVNSLQYSAQEESNESQISESVEELDLQEPYDRSIL